MTDQNKRPLVIKKIKKGGHGHHGGAWKVAYADFVTAMMAFFLLLWLLNSVTKENLSGVADYFAPTVGLKGEKGIGFQGGKSPSDEGSKKSEYSNPSVMYGSPSEGAIIEYTEDSRLHQFDKIDEQNFAVMQKDISNALDKNQALKDFKDRVLFDQTPEGLRIQILENSGKPLFVPGTYELQSYTKGALSVIGEFIKLLPNYISIEGHTTPMQNRARVDVDNWFISSQRANATRRYLNENMIDNEQILRIVGKADQEPLKPQDPSNLSNIRISMIILKNALVPYQKKSLPPNLLK